MYSKKIGKLVSMVGIGALFFILVSFFGHNPRFSEKHATKPALSNKTLTRLQVPFIANVGQKSSGITYYAPIREGTIFLTQNGSVSYVFAEKGGVAERISEEFLLKPSIEPGSESTVIVNYYNGKNRYTHIPAFDSITLKRIQRGVDLTLKAYNREVEKIFEVRPGTSPDSIVIRVKGVKRIKLVGNSLLLTTRFGEFFQTPPKVYQIINGKKIRLRASYVLLGRNSYGFDVEGYDPRHPLYIDPIMYSTYVGGGAMHCEDENETRCGNDGGGYLLVKNDSIYVVGYTYGDIPVSTDAYSTTISGGKDIFIARFNRNLNELLAATYIGGSDDERPGAIAADSSGNIYISGLTRSRDFPIVNGFDGLFRGDTDIFIAKFNPDLSTLISSTYLGGSGEDVPYSLMVSDDVTVVGETDSRDFPVTTISPPAGETNAFVTKLSEDLTQLKTSTLIGGSDDDFATDVTFSGNTLIVVGGTFSDDLQANGYLNGAKDGFLSILSYDLTSTHTTYSEIERRDQFERVVAYQGKFYIAGTGTRRGTARDIFVVNWDPATSTLSAPVYMGGEDIDKATSMTILGQFLYIGGWTDSTDLPYTASGFRSINSGDEDGFVARFDINTNTFDLATYLGGKNSDVVRALASDRENNTIYIAGETKSYDFPVTNGFDDTNNGATDLFILKMSNLSRLDAGTFIGGGGREQLNKIISTDNAIYVGGWSESYDIPATGEYTIFHGDTDALVVKLTRDLRKITAMAYIGGSGDDRLLNMRIYPESNRLYAIGKTRSSDFPTSPFAIGTYANGGYDAFVFSLYADSLTGLSSTYIGTPATDRGFDILKISGTDSLLTLIESNDTGTFDTYLLKISTDLTAKYGSISIHGSNEDRGTKMVQAADLPGKPVYVVGWTDSPDLSGLNGYDTTYEGDTDGFIARVNPYSLEISNVTLLGGNLYDSVNAIKIIDNPLYGPLVYVAGETYSKNFTVTTGYPKSSTDQSDFFITAMTPDLKTVAISRIYGGSRDDKANTLSPLGKSLVVSGKTISPHLATKGAYDSTYNGLEDGFIARFPLSLTEPLSISYIGGSSNDSIISSDYDGKLLYLAGRTSSGNFPVTAEALKSYKGGCSDGFIAAFSVDYFTRPPELRSFTATPKTGNPPLTVELNAEIYIPSDPDVSSSVKAVWSCDTGDKVIQQIDQTGTSTLTHTCTYEKGGSYLPNIRIESYGDKTTSGSISIHVNIPPIIDSLVISPQPATAPVTVQFTISARDQDGEIKEYRWKIGDLTDWTVTTTPEYSYKFEDGYKGNITVEVVDDQGATATLEKSFEIFSPSTNGTEVNAISKEKSSGCGCNITGSNNWGDIIPFILLFMMWLAVKRREEKGTGG